MAITQFPNPEEVDPEGENDGLIALGGDLEPASLILAYKNGIFPWPMTGMPLPWFCPWERAVLEYDRLNINSRARRAIRSAGFQVTFNHQFDQVIERCARVPRSQQKGTWITAGIKKAYRELHRLGFAHSVEVWLKNDLVGGLYGVSVEGCFSAESMFRDTQHPHSNNASKAAVLALMEHLHSQGLDWIDVQQESPHLCAWGAHTLLRPKFLEKLKHTQSEWKQRGSSTFFRVAQK